eukprot:Nk52_evm36s255 gene=Nk52_evmTU36s255
MSVRRARLRTGDRGGGGYDYEQGDVDSASGTEYCTSQEGSPMIARRKQQNQLPTSATGTAGGSHGASTSGRVLPAVFDRYRQLSGSDSKLGPFDDDSDGASGKGRGASRDGGYQSHHRHGHFSNLLPYYSFGFYLLCFTIIAYSHHVLPSPLPAATTPAARFSEERAATHLSNILEYGIRMTGSDANEFKTVEYLIKEIDKIKEEAIENPKSRVNIEYEIQTPSGGFYLEFLEPFTNVYYKVKNILVRVSAKEGSYDRRRLKKRTDEADIDGKKINIEAGEEEDEKAFITDGRKEKKGMEEGGVKYPDRAEGGNGDPRRNLRRQEANVHELVKNAELNDSSSMGNPALLISSHFDSALGTVAASDDLSMICVMLESLRNLAHDESIDLVSDIIMNFNGAEETILQASHGFITQHRWANDIKAFVNLEGAGGWGRELVFQAGPGNSWLAEAYGKAASYPHASVIGQDIFQSGIIPSDTDYRIYRDFGEIPGIDIAFIGNGYIYHTPLDDGEHMVAGSMQRAGDNLVNVVKEIVRKPIVINNEDEIHRDGAVYFDVCGIFTIVYSLNFANALNSIVLLATVVFTTYYGLFHKHNTGFQVNGDRTFFFRQLAMTLCVLCLSMLAAVIFPAIVAFLMVYIMNRRMVWFANPYLTILIFANASWIAIGTVKMLYHEHCVRESYKEYRKRKMSTNDAKYVGNIEHHRHHSNINIRLENQAYFAGMWFWWILLFLCTQFRLGSGYLPLTFVGFSLLSRAFSILSGLESLHLEDSANVKKYLFFFVYYFCLIMPTLFLGQLVQVVLSFFIPIMGRSGTVVPSDIVIAALIGIFVALLSSVVSSVIHLDRHWNRTRLVLIGVLIVGLVLALVSSPYTSERPKRLFMHHLERTWYDAREGDHSTQTPVKRDTGMWFAAMDFNDLEPLRNSSIAEFTTTAKATDCMGPYCSFPYYLPLTDVIPSGWYIDMEGPTAPKDRHLPELRVLKSAKNMEQGTRRLDFVLKGPDHMALYFDLKDVKIKKWSLSPDIPEEERDKHFVFFASGEKSVEYNFWIEYKGLSDIDIALAGHYFEENTPALEKLMANKPSWLGAIGWVVFWNDYVF